jgi:hypothetical protein
LPAGFVARAWNTDRRTPKIKMCDKPEAIRSRGMRRQFKKHRAPDDDEDSEGGAGEEGKLEAL